MAHNALPLSFICILDLKSSTFKQEKHSTETFFAFSIIIITSYFHDFFTFTVLQQEAQE